jgi:hypothetical protein
MSATADNANEIATVRIELNDTEPLIWREVEVPTSITFATLHNIVQAAMGWDDSHLSEFTIGKRRYGFGVDEDWGDPATDAQAVRLREVLRPRTTHIGYLYDFGDCWRHKLTVTKIRAGDPAFAYPRYVAGEQNRPLEDCGGLLGFYAKLEALADPDDPEHDEIKEWLGDYDPDEVPEAAIKKRLEQIAKYLGATKAKPRKRKPAPKA